MSPIRTMLPNGLRLLVMEQPHLQTAVLTVFVRVGSRFESPEDNGLSHFLEHMLCRGTVKYPNPYSITRAVEALGGSPLCAETGKEDCLYQIAIPPDSMEQGLALLYEVVCAPVYEGIATERNVVLEEMHEGIGADGQCVDLGEMVWREAFAGSALAPPVIGQHENVRRFTQADLRRHHAAHYGAASMVVCATGAVCADRFAAAVGAFVNLPASERPSPILPVAALHGPRRIHEAGDPGRQSEISLAFRICGENDTDAPAINLLWRVLDGGMSSRLYQRIVHERGLAYDVSSSLCFASDAGLLDLHANAAHASVPDLVEEMLGLCHGLCAAPVTSDELALAKRRYRWSMLGLCDDPAGLADVVGRCELFDPLPSLDMRWQRVQALQAEDLLSVARRVLVPSGLTVGTVGRLNAQQRNRINAAIVAYMAE